MRKREESVRGSTEKQYVSRLLQVKFRYTKISETDVNFGSLVVTFIFTLLLFSLDLIVF